MADTQEPALTDRLRALGLSVERSVKQWRWLVQLSRVRQVRDRWQEQSRHQDRTNTAAGQPDRGRCLLDLRRIACDGEQGRRFHALVALLTRGGWELSMVPRLTFLQTGHRAFKANAIKAIRPFTGDEPPFDLCLSDGKSDHPRAERTIRVVADTRRPVTAGDLAMPYSFYPMVWDNGEDQRFDQYRHQERIWRFFFGGHCSRESYQRIRKYTRMRPVDRYTVIQDLLAHFGGKTISISSDEALRECGPSPADSFVMIDNAHYRMDASQWLGTLAKADFFLAAPGCDYPLSHNAVEAIAVGTIPVLEYDELFTPALRDGVNCIAYRGRSGLPEAMRRIEAMTPGEVSRLREGVISYYENHLSPTAFCDELTEADTKRVHLFSYLTPAAAA